MSSDIQTADQDDGVRVDYDSRGDLDDIAVSGVDVFRMERMDDGCFWIRLYRPGGKDIVFWLNSARKIVGSHELDQS